MRESLREQLEKVRPLPHLRLRNFAIEALKSGDRSMKRLDDDPEAALALFEINEIELKWAAKLEEVAREIGLTSQGDTGSQPRYDRQSEQTERRASQSMIDSQAANDRPVANGSGPSRGSSDSHRRSDRPAPRAKAPAPRTKIRRGAVLAYASTSIFARQIGSGIKQVGDVTRFDVLQIKRRGMIDSTIADGLLELDWPDEDRTPLHKIASEEQVSAVFKRAYRVLDSLGVTNAPA